MSIVNPFVQGMERAEKLLADRDDRIWRLQALNAEMLEVLKAVAYFTADRETLAELALAAIAKAEGKS